MTVPPEAIEAAKAALSSLPAGTSLWGYELANAARRAAEAAAPLIAAAERERLSQPGDGDPKFCKICGADLIGGPA
jgi:hypothetical protein